MFFLRKYIFLSVLRILHRNILKYHFILFSTKSLGGGTVLDLGVYAIQFASLVYNNEMPHTVRAVGCLNEEGVDQSISASFVYEGNRTATILTHALVDLPNEAYIIGTNGKIKISNFWCPTTAELPSGTVNVPLPRGELPFNFKNSAGLRYEADEVRNCILKGTVCFLVSRSIRIFI